MTPRPRTVVVILTFTPDGREVSERYEFDGRMVERTQLLSFLRDSGLNYWGAVNAQLATGKDDGVS